MTTTALWKSVKSSPTPSPGKVPSTKGYTEYTYEVTDTMSEGLTFNNDVKVTIGGVDVTAAATIKNNENGFVASINMMKYQDQIDAPVVITYTATVNEKAIQRNEETNTATLKYSNNPADKNSFGESHEEVEVFSFKYRHQQVRRRQREHQAGGLQVRAEER